jgi:hypothetical protein
MLLIAAAIKNPRPDHKSSPGVVEQDYISSDLKLSYNLLQRFSHLGQ